MTWYAPTSGTTSISSTGDGDGVFIAPNVTISTTTTSAVSLMGANCEVDVYGTVVATETNALWLGTGTNQQGHTIHVHEDAFVRSFYTTGIVVVGYQNDIVNEGYIMGVTAGLQLGDSNAAASSSRIVNSGTISSSNDSYGAVFHHGQETIILQNSGTISNSGLGGSFQDNESARSEIKNTGLMNGDIKLGGGADLYDGRSGKVVGTVFGGDGDDDIRGGKEKNILDGGNDDDVLAGGKGNDTFVFAEGYGKDRITDFGKGNDRIDLSVWAAVDSFADVKSHARNHGADVWIKAGSDVLIIENTHKADLHNGDFIF